jgi:hypothetical protein
VGEGDPGSPVSRTCAHQGEPGGVESRAGTRGSSGWWSQIMRVRIAFLLNSQHSLPVLAIVAGREQLGNRSGRFRGSGQFD